MRVLENHLESAFHVTSLQYIPTLPTQHRPHKVKSVRKEVKLSHRINRLNMSEILILLFEPLPSEYPKNCVSLKRE